MAPFLGLGVGLQAVALLLEQDPDRARTDRVPAASEGQRQLAGALARPPQGRLRVAANVRVDECVERRCQFWICLGQRLSPGTRSADTSVDRRRSVEILHPVVERLA